MHNSLVRKESCASAKSWGQEGAKHYGNTEKELIEGVAMGWGPIMKCSLSALPYSLSNVISMHTWNIPRY